MKIVKYFLLLCDFYSPLKAGLKLEKQGNNIRMNFMFVQANCTYAAYVQRNIELKYIYNIYKCAVHI